MNVVFSLFGVVVATKKQFSWTDFEMKNVFLKVKHSLNNKYHNYCAYLNDNSV